MSHWLAWAHLPLLTSAIDEIFLLLLATIDEVCYWFFVILLLIDTIDYEVSFEARIFMFSGD